MLIYVNIGKIFFSSFQIFSESKDIKKHNMILGQINIYYYIKKNKLNININYYLKSNNFSKEKLIYNSEINFIGLNEFFIEILKKFLIFYLI